MKTTSSAIAPRWRSRTAHHASTREKMNAKYPQVWLK
jgi:hypothetical protein